ncbi:MAG: T9SS type A sorting domain-containing protein [Candidatus Edwardsbacteria bacterium]|nr:T9SS type A sorting domain-containing protein [Candidatus Edwardsbacteria bacterium]
MKNAGLYILSLFIISSFTWALPPAPRLEKSGIENPKAGPISIKKNKDTGDLVFTGVHDFSCYMTAARCIDMDPGFGTDGAVILFLRGTDGNIHYVGTIDGGTSWSTMGPLTGSIRYPSAMCDRVNQKPVAFYNWGWGAVGEGAYTLWDDGNYNDGLWGSETEVDTLGRDVAGSAYYCVNGTMGSNGVYHVLANYWGDFTPDASFYFRSTDNGNSWERADPRSDCNMYYDLFGTEDSLNIFKGGSVVHDPIVAGYVNQVQVATSLDGNTVMVGSCGLTPDTLGKVLFWYRMSTDAGINWGPLTFAPDPGVISWESESYDLGIAVDEDGYPHFATYLAMDTLDDGTDYGPLSGIYDYHLTTSGWVLTQICGAIDSSGGLSVYPDFCNYALDPSGDLILTFTSNWGDIATSDIYITKSTDNGASYGAPLKITDGTQACWYPHIPYRVGGVGTYIPVFYQVGNDGYVHWVGPYAPPPPGVNYGSISFPVYELALNKNYPNPVKGYTNISFTLPKNCPYSLKVYNIAGQLVKSIDGHGQKGPNHLKCNIGGFANGVYLYNITANGRSATGKMAVLK